MSAAAKPRRRYEGGGIGELRGPRSRVELPSADRINPEAA